MTLLLINYAIFSNPVLLVIGYLIAGLEAITAVLQFIKVVFKNNTKIVKKIDSKISKYQKAIQVLKERQAYYNAEIAYQNAHVIPINETAPASKITKDDTDIAENADNADDIDKINAEAQQDIDEHEKAEFDTTDYDDEPADDDTLNDNESYELFKKFVAQVKKND